MLTSQAAEEPKPHMMTEMFTVHDIAHWFLKNKKGITNKKLQKLAYYAYSWYLVLNNENTDNITIRFFENKFEAWMHGAVYPELHTMYKKYGSGAIPVYEGSLPEFTENDLNILNQVLAVYGGFTGHELESICLQESPWQTARKSLPEHKPSHEPITDKAIFDYYSARLS